MAELIERAALKAELGAACLLDLDAGIPIPGGKDYTVRMAIDAAPTVDAALVVHARWTGNVGARCSVCGDVNVRAYIGKAPKYCQECGARMDADAPDQGEGSGQ